jgi:hypothetical protein
MTTSSQTHEIAPAMPGAKTRAGLRLLVVLALLAATGCAGVKPWERGPLSDYIMRPDRDTLADGLYEHVYFTREAAAGGRGVGGGGCGCN